LGDAVGDEADLLVEAERVPVQLALAALGVLREGQRDAADVLRTSLRKARPTLVPRMS
jgi:hypothetical protein